MIDVTFMQLWQAHRARLKLRIIRNDLMNLNSKAIKLKKLLGRTKTRSLRQAIDAAIEKAQEVIDAIDVREMGLKNETP